MIKYTSQRITKILGLIALTGLTGFMEAQVSLNWSPAGPIYNAGRSRNMVVDQSNSNILYVGSSSSGIFKSMNGGSKWYAINDQAEIRNISYMAQDANGTVYAATGEGFLRAGQKSKALPGTGLYKLNPSDSSLVQVVSSTVVGTVINRIACSPIAAGHIALATNMGIFVSTDGSTFNQATLPGAPTGTTISGQDVKFDHNGILYCSIGSEFGIGSASNASMIFKSPDASLAGSYSAITPSSSVLTDNYYGRIELAIAPSNNNVIYASCANKYVQNSDNSSTLKGLFVSYDAGTTWALIAQGSSQLDPLSNGGTIASGDYAQVLMVNPTNSNQLFFGSFSFYIWTRNNTSNTNPLGDWVSLGQPYYPNNQYYLHQNIHDIKFVPGSTPRIYFVTDAGVFRSTDLAPLLGNLFYNYNIGNYPSFQPFYKGLVTGQFNSVSIERFPIGDSLNISRQGGSINPYSGFIGGTGGNGLNYFSGLDTLVTIENSWIGGEIYNAQYSKILPNAAIASTGEGTLYHSSDVKTSAPTVIKINSYINGLSTIAATPNDFANNNNNVTGTSFRLWENYMVNSPDSAVFYNDSVRYGVSVSGVPTLTTATVFPFSTARPNAYAVIDSIVIRTGTVTLPITGTYSNSPAPYNAPGDGKTIYLRVPRAFAPSTTTTTTLNVTPVGSSTLPVTFTFNTQTLIDNFVVTFPTPPFKSKTATQYPANATGTAIVISDPSVYYRVFATVFYRYPIGAVVTTTDNNISTKTNTYAATVTDSLNWHYGSFPNYTISAPSLTATPAVAVTNPTMFVIFNNSLTRDTVLLDTLTVLGTNTVLTPRSARTYTVREFGTFTLSAIPVIYTLGISPMAYTLVSTNTTATSYTLNPGNIVQTTASTSIPGTFTVAPTTSITIYTITANTSPTVSTFTVLPTSYSISPSAGTSPLVSSPSTFTIAATNPTVATTTYTLSQYTGTNVVQTTTVLIGSTIYSLNPGAITQTDNPIFVVNTGTTAITYNIYGISSSTVIGANTHTTFAFPLSSIITMPFVVPMSKNNRPVKIPAVLGARLGMILNNSGNTGGANAIVVSKNPLALNDPLSVVRVSQVGVPIWTDDANGNATTNTITVSGVPTILEWSKSGTELYFATTNNNLYRVSHINTIMDLSPSSYSGKFYNDIFRYTAPISTSSLNSQSPFRTTLVGTFDRTITSISVSNDSKHVALTFNTSSNPTGTTAAVMYSSNDISVSTATSAGWANKQGTLPTSVTVTYCSLMEKNNDKMVFVGTQDGIYVTQDITSGPTWSNVNDLANSNSKLPKVQVFDIKQQTIKPWDCYNSGEIYVATNGRGIWVNRLYLEKYTVGIQEYQKPIQGKNLNMYPNPTNGNVFLSFTAVEGETAHLQIMDISGRMVQSEDLGKLNGGEFDHSFETSKLTSGVYIVNVSSDSGVKRVSKLIVTK